MSETNGARPAGSVEIVEVGPRDGLQDEARLVSVADKVAYLRGVIAAGVRRVEVTSFVDPRRVPQMADAEAVLAALGRPPGVTRVGLVLNERGMARAAAAGVDEINAVVVVTETFSRRNQGMTVDESVAAWSHVAVAARDAGIRATVTLSAAFGCPYEGVVPPARVVALAEAVAAADPAEIALADTIGAAVPTEVGPLVSAVAEATGRPVRGHFHNTRNAGFANAVAAVAAGAAALDASTGGIGGCPFAPGAAGNIATEDLVHLLERMGVRTGIDVDALLAVIPALERAVGHPVPGQLAKSGPFPPRPAPD